ncbi:hypothetical protein C8T65DRAFT_646213 [Cerioporus squamosus]|nr:hypothetical protein C8T65DRAFT_646213 [Cerioporus squamosus]
MTAKLGRSHSGALTAIIRRALAVPLVMGVHARGVFETILDARYRHQGRGARMSPNSNETPDSALCKLAET